MNAYYQLSPQERETIERALQYIVYVYYADDTVGLQRFVDYAHDLGIYRHCPLMIDIVTIVMSMIASEA